MEPLSQGTKPADLDKLLTFTLPVMNMHNFGEIGKGRLSVDPYITFPNAKAVLRELKLWVEGFVKYEKGTLDSALIYVVGDADTSLLR